MLIWGRNGFDGGVEAGIAGGSEDAALKASTVYKLNNNNKTLLAA